MHWLLAHSGAGVIASQLAEALPQRIAGIIYVAGIMLPSDVRFAELVAEYMTVDRTASGIGPFLEWSKDLTVSRVPESAARHIFFHDVDPTTADWAVRRLTPQPEGGRAVRPSLSAARFGSVRRIYIETIADRSVVHGLQRHMQQVVPGAERLSLNTGHFPQLVAPRQLAEMIRSQIHRNPDGC
jgi:pimeloyl-ACP methyl ester carboxylesterase